jgi:hypothetical protein
LLRAHYAEAVPAELLKEEQQRIAVELEQADNRLKATEQRVEQIEETSAMRSRSVRTARMYREAPPQVRRHANQTVFAKLLVHDGEVVVPCSPSRSHRCWLRRSPATRSRGAGRESESARRRSEALRETGRHRLHPNSKRGKREQQRARAEARGYSSSSK